MKKFIIYNLKFIIILFILYIVQSALYITPAYAQTPSNWQNNATGLRVSSNSDQKTAGLTTIIKASGIPFISLQGGVKNQDYGLLSGPTGIELGQIKVPGTTPALTSESADWAHNEMTFTNNNLKIWVSRLSPAVLIQNLNNSLRLFSGNLNGATFVPSQWAPYPLQVTNRTPSPSYPKYVAFFSGGVIQVRQIPTSSSVALNLPALDNNWILVWYGDNSHFVDLKLPLGYAPEAGWLFSLYTIDMGYQADAPILVRFQNNPTGIKQSSEGGIDLTFSGNSGYTLIMPLLGREYPASSSTESWGSNSTLASDILAKINFWVTGNRLCSYPASVFETYAYNSASDTAGITDNISYLNVCPGGSTTSGFATIPPALSLARDSFGTNFNITGTLVNSSYPTEFGPIWGIDNTNSYTWSITGLKKYTDSNRILGNNPVPEELIQELATEIDGITRDGHYKPWLFINNQPRSLAARVYFANPADIISSLAEIAPVVPEPQKTNLINYFKNEKNNYSPETVFNLPNNIGTQREPFADPDYNRFYNNFPSNTLLLKRVPLYNFFALSRYYDLTKDPILSSVTSAAKTVLNADMAEQDWATASWFKGFKQNRSSVVAANRHLVGMIGYVKLMKAAGDQTESLGRSLLVKAIVNRLAMVKYPRYLYTANIVNLPAQANWMLQYSTASQVGYLFNSNWTSGNDDVLQVAIQDQFGTYLADGTGYFIPGTPPWDSTNDNWFTFSQNGLAAYLDLVPEAFRILIDYAKSDFEIYLNKYTAMYPNWFQSFSEGVLGMEHDLSYPTDAFQLFMAKKFIQNESPENLRKYRSISYLDSGDFFYMQKLAETIKAYQGVRWEDEPVLGASTKASPSSQPPTFNLFELIKTSLKKIFK